MKYEAKVKRKQLAKANMPKSVTEPLRAATLALLRRSCSTNDVRNALRLLNHLQCCHRAALDVPGVDSALQSDARFGIHFDPAYVFVEKVLYEAKSWCEWRMNELVPKEKRHQ
jgi:hypothetical protein